MQPLTNDELIAEYRRNYRRLHQGRLWWLWWRVCPIVGGMALAWLFWAALALLAERLR